MSQTILITGASTGLGKATALHFLEQGWNVVATMRKPEAVTDLPESDALLKLQLDVQDKQSIASAVETALAHFGKIDVLLNNAGYGAAGPIEAATDAQIRHQFDVNLFGLIDVTKAVLPSMRHHKAGLIMNVSSVGGRITLPFFSLYHASKFALEGLTEAMQYELNPLGIQLKIIEPGGFKTDFATRSLVIFDTEDLPDYQAGLQQFTQSAMARLDEGGTPESAAEAIFAAATDGKDQLRYPVGEDAVQVLGARQQSSDLTMKQMMQERYGL